MLLGTKCSCLDAAVHVARYGGCNWYEVKWCIHYLFANACSNVLSLFGQKEKVFPHQAMKIVGVGWCNCAH
jgi:hypothetical protein